MRLVPAGPRATLLALDEEPSLEASVRLAGLRRRLAAAAPPEALDLVPGFASLLVEHRATLTPHARRAWLDRAAGLEDAAPSPRRHTFRVAYGEAADVAELEARLGLPFEAIARAHAAHEATVAFLGFTPGFPYLAGLPDALRVPRRERPVERIPAGAVAIGAGRGGVYPSASPGGWWVVGRTDARLFDPERDPPATLRPGDRIRFEAVAPGDLRPAPEEERPPVDAPEGRIEVLEAVPGSASLQGRPRWGGAHLGLAQAGALDPLALEAANAMVGNAADTLALELLGQPLTLRSERTRIAAVAGGGLALALDGRPLRTWRAFAWPAGSTLELLPDPSVSGRTGVLAVAGGLRGHDWRGSDSTDLRARAGGSRGWLESGDAVALGSAPVGAPLAHPGRPLYPRRVLLRLHPGPQYDPEAFETLVRHGYRLAAMDRTGARLDGPVVPLATERHDSGGSPWGAVQLPPNGQPIVLLNDRGRTGGYPQPAVVDARDLWRLAQARAGDPVWLVDARGETKGPEPLDSVP